MLDLTPRTLAKMRVEGSGPPFIRLTGRRVGYSVTELRKWIDSRRVTSTSALPARAAP